MVSVWLTELVQGTGFDLSYALPGDRKSLSDFLQCFGSSIVESESHSNHGLFARVQCANQSRQIVFEHLVGRLVDRLLVWISHHVTNRKTGTTSASQTSTGSLQFRRGELLFHGNGLLGHTIQEIDSIRRETRSFHNLFGCGLSAQVGFQFSLGFSEGTKLVVNVHRQSNGASLIGNGTHDALLDPPGGIGRKAESSLGIEFFACPGEPQDALLGQILKGHTTVLVAFRNGNHQSNVRLGQGGLCSEGATDLLFQLGNRHVRLDGSSPFCVCWRS
mmetsp:Transcript_10007/g.24984  ORF Transcript_10007/g.24984 Transcript_10007/m.24984 type:complete len:275 (-) Transcript_10007:559-1383(-)